jgi:protein-S-isoprenylcysteine O-methyltransferase Ste14
VATKERRPGLKDVRLQSMKLLVGILTFVLVPLLAWGPDDLRGFFSHPARLAYVALTVLLQVLIVVRFPGVGPGRRPGTRTVRRQRVALALLFILSFALVIAAGHGVRREIAPMGGGDFLRYAGLALYSVGLLASAWVEEYLGKQFSLEVTLQEGHRLITDGPYRRLRHPRYLAVIVFTAGLALVFRSWPALAVVAAMTLVLLWRIRDEEALMREAFGAEWESYARRTSRLIPFVY